MTEKGEKSFQKSRTLHSDCFSNNFQFPIHVKEIKTENGSQCIQCSSCKKDDSEMPTSTPMHKERSLPYF